MSLFALAIWCRDWIGVWCLIPVALSIVWIFVNPLFFKAPKSTRNWASRGVLGERIWVDRDKIELPEQFRSRTPSLVANGYSTIGIGLLAYGLIDLNVLATVTGILITHGGKAWYLDRISLLFADMKRPQQRVRVLGLLMFSVSLGLEKRKSPPIGGLERGSDGYSGGRI